MARSPQNWSAFAASVLLAMFDRTGRQVEQGYAEGSDGALRVNWDKHSLASSERVELGGVGVGDEGVFPLMIFVNSTTRTLRNATFPSKRRTITINKSMHHLNRLLSRFFWGRECIGAREVVGRGDFSFLSTFSGAQGDMGRTDTRSISW
jgi:hypothetical protein